MKHRQLKKLCKKAYSLMTSPSASKELGVNQELMGFDEDEGMHLNWFPCSFEGDEYDYRTTWSFLVEMYIITFTDFDGAEMVFIGKRPTPSNVFKWAKTL